MTPPFRRLVCGSLVLALFATGCGQTVTIPRSDYPTVIEDERYYLDVKTDSTRYRVKHFTVTDSSLVITSVDAGEDGYPTPADEWQVPPQIPYELSFGAIKSMRYHDPAGLWTDIAIVVVIVGGTLALLAALFQGVEYHGN